MIDCKDKHIVIIGATGGLGRILCKKLASEGALLSISGRNQEKLNEITNELSDNKIFSKNFDIRNEEEVSLFFEEAYKEFGKIYALINLAGLSIPGNIPETDISAYDLMMDVNVKGTFLAAKHFTKYASSPAIVVNTGSMAAKNANPNAPLYCTSKAAVDMMSRALLLQVGSKDIRVTTINPGGIDTEFWGERKVDRTKLMNPEEVVDIFMFVIKSNPNIQIHEINFESKRRF